MLDLDHAACAPGVTSSTTASSMIAGGEGQRHRRHRAEQHQVERRLADALEHEDAEAAAADQRRDRGEADVLHQHDADAGEDHRKGQRQLDCRAGAGRRSCPCRAPHRSPRAARHRARPPCWPPPAAANRGTAPGAPASTPMPAMPIAAAPGTVGGDPGQRRDQQPEQRDRGDGLHAVEHVEDRRAQPRHCGGRRCRAGSPTTIAATSEPSDQRPDACPPRARKRRPGWHIPAAPKDRSKAPSTGPAATAIGDQPPAVRSAATA